MSNKPKKTKPHLEPDPAFEGIVDANIFQNLEQTLENIENELSKESSDEEEEKWQFQLVIF